MEWASVPKTLAEREMPKESAWPVTPRRESHSCLKEILALLNAESSTLRLMITDASSSAQKALFQEATISANLVTSKDANPAPSLESVLNVSKENTATSLVTLFTITSEAEPVSKSALPRIPISASSSKLVSTLLTASIAMTIVLNVLEPKMVRTCVWPVKTLMTELLK